MEQTRPPDPRTRPAPTQERTRTAPAQPATARPNVQPTAAPVVQGPPPENLTIAPAVSGSEAGSLAFDWEAVTMGSNRSYACAVSTSDAVQISVTMTQGMYRRSYGGEGVVKTGPVPPAPVGTEGSMTARNESTGESATYSWRWQPKSVTAPPVRPGSSRGGLLGKLFSRGKTETQTQTKQALSIAQRLGSRAALAVTVKFFGQAATGQRFAFLLDKSGSMSGLRWQACTTQLTTAIRALPPHVEFVVILYDLSVSMAPQQSGWLKADRAEIDGVMKWLSTQKPGGGTSAMPAIERAFSFADPPDVIYFLTDGDVPENAPEICERVRGKAPTIINTIALENDSGRDVLVAIAQQTGGEFILISNAGAAGA